MQHPQDLQHQQLHSAVSHIIIPTSQVWQIKLAIIVVILSKDSKEFNAVDLLFVIISDDADLVPSSNHVL